MKGFRVPVLSQTSTRGAGAPLLLSLRDSALPDWLDWWGRTRGLLLASLIVIYFLRPLSSPRLSVSLMLKLVLPTKCSAYSLVISLEEVPWAHSQLNPWETSASSSSEAGGVERLLLNTLSLGQLCDLGERPLPLDPGSEIMRGDSFQTREEVQSFTFSIHFLVRSRLCFSAY